jgi:hypothetical protein
MKMSDQASKKAYRACRYCGELNPLIRQTTGYCSVTCEEKGKGLGRAGAADTINRVLEQARAEYAAIHNRFQASSANLVSADPRRHFVLLADGTKVGCSKFARQRKKAINDWISKWGPQLVGTKHRISKVELRGGPPVREITMHFSQLVDADKDDRDPDREPEQKATAARDNWPEYVIDEEPVEPDKDDVSGQIKADAALADRRQRDEAADVVAQLAKKQAGIFSRSNAWKY